MALKKDPSKVKSKSINVRLSPEQCGALQEWSKRAKLSPTTNEPKNVSELLREAIIIATTVKK
jgi:hypothetical protein